MTPGESNYPTNVDRFLSQATLQYSEVGCEPDWTKTVASPVGSQPAAATGAAGGAVERFSIT